MVVVMMVVMVVVGPGRPRRGATVRSPPGVHIAAHLGECAWDGGEARGGGRGRRGRGRGPCRLPRSDGATRGGDEGATPCPVPTRAATHEAGGGDSEGGGRGGRGGRARTTAGRGAGRSPAAPPQPLAPTRELPQRRRPGREERGEGARQGHHPTQVHSSGATVCGGVPWVRCLQLGPCDGEPLVVAEGRLGAVQGLQRLGARQELVLMGRCEGGARPVAASVSHTRHGRRGKQHGVRGAGRCASMGHPRSTHIARRWSCSRQEVPLVAPITTGPTPRAAGAPTIAKGHVALAPWRVAHTEIKVTHSMSPNNARR